MTKQGREKAPRLQRRTTSRPARSLETALRIPPLALVLNLCLLLSLSLHPAAAASAAEAPDGLSLRLETVKETAYPGERVPITVTLRVSGAKVRDLRYPQLPSRGLAPVTFSTPRQEEEQDGEATVTVYRFSGTIAFPRPGGVLIGPARLDCDILESTAGTAAFFGGEKPRRVTVYSEAVRVSVPPLPVSGRPPSFSGAIGAYTMRTIAKPGTAVAGDPVTITTVITGSGTLADASCPGVTPRELQTFPVRALRCGEDLVCEQVIVPSRPVELPPLRWSYFDPATGSYRTLTGSLASVKVVAPAPSKAVAPRARITAPTAALPRSNKAPVLPWISLLVTVAAALAFRFRKPAGGPSCKEAVTPSRRVGFQRQLQDAEQALQAGDVQQFYDAVVAALQEAVAPFGNEAAPTVCGVAATPSLPASDRVEALFIKCHSVRYGRREPSEGELSEDLETLRTLLAAIASHPL